MGAGKSTLVEFLSRTYGAVPFYEPSEDNPYLDDFYSDMARWAFHSQIFFLGSKFRLHRELDRRERAVVLDRTIYEDAEIFATALCDMGVMDDRDWDTYGRFYETILDTISPPDLLIYLRCPVAVLRQRLCLRGRDAEQSLPRGYLERLARLYARWIDAYDRSEVLVLDTERLDYISDLVHRLDVMQAIEAVIPDSLRSPSR